MDIFVVFCPDGVMSYEDMATCKKEKWVPIATITNGDKVTVPCFTDGVMASKFGKRNYPKDWISGVIALSIGEIKWMQQKGWRLEIFSFPRLVKDLPGFGYEVLEFQSDPELHMKRR